MKGHLLHNIQNHESKNKEKLKLRLKLVLT
jgi:hypothetical protein